MEKFEKLKQMALLMIAAIGFVKKTQHIFGKQLPRLQTEVRKVLVEVVKTCDAPLSEAEKEAEFARLFDKMQSLFPEKPHFATGGIVTESKPGEWVDVREYIIKQS